MLKIDDRRRYRIAKRLIIEKPIRSNKRTIKHTTINRSNRSRNDINEEGLIKRLYGTINTTDLTYHV